MTPHAQKPTDEMRQRSVDRIAFGLGVALSALFFAGLAWTIVLALFLTNDVKPFRYMGF